MAFRRLDIFPYRIRPTSESSLSVEVAKRGLRRRKQVFFFERFTGGIDYNLNDPESSVATLITEADSLVCRDAILSAAKRKELARESEERTAADGGLPANRLHVSRIRRASQHRFDSHGTLTLCRKNQPIMVDVATIANKDRIELNVRHR